MRVAHSGYKAKRVASNMPICSLNKKLRRKEEYGYAYAVLSLTATGQSICSMQNH